MLFNKVLAGESIDYDDSRTWVKEVIKIFETYKPSQGRELCNALSKTISNGIEGNVTVRLEDNPVVSIGILPPDVSIKHPLVNEYRGTASSGKDGVSLLYKMDKAVGGVDLAKGTLYGEASKLPMVIVVTQGFLNFTLDAEESAATIAHEVGHGVGYILGLTQLVRASAIIANGVSVLTEEPERSKRIDFVKAAVQIQGVTLDASEVTALADVDDKRVIGGMFAVNSSEGFRSKYGSPLYDNQLFETIADNFAARCGLSVPLASALVKLHKSHYSFETMNTPTFIILELIKVMWILLSMTNVVGLITLMMAGYNNHLQNSEYPSLLGRLEKLKQDANLQLKDSDVSKAKRRLLLADIDRLEALMDVVKRETGLVRELTTWVFTSKKDRSRKDTVRSLEALVANDLHNSKQRINERLDSVK